MVTITLHCLHCQSDALVRNGHAPHGKQLYRCRACGRQSRENPTPSAYPEARREEILHAYQERSSLRDPTNVTVVFEEPEIAVRPRGECGNLVRRHRELGIRWPDTLMMHHITRDIS
jgi:hypothetical protein